MMYFILKEQDDGNYLIVWYTGEERIKFKTWQKRDYEFGSNCHIKTQMCL